MKKLWRKMVTALGKAPSNTQENAKNADNSSYNYEAIENTPFLHVKDPERGWYIVLADTRITEPIHNKQKSLEQVTEINWKTLTTIIATIVQKVIEKKEEEAKQQRAKDYEELTKEYTQ
jgi:hypothetical protein